MLTEARSLAGLSAGAVGSRLQVLRSLYRLGLQELFISHPVTNKACDSKAEVAKLTLSVNDLAGTVGECQLDRAVPLNEAGHLSKQLLKILQLQAEVVAHRLEHVLRRDRRDELAVEVAQRLLHHLDVRLAAAHRRVGRDARQRAEDSLSVDLLASLESIALGRVAAPLEAVPA